MALKLQDFMSEIRSLGIQRANRFNVELDPPRSLKLGGNGILGFLGGFADTGRTRQLTLRCNSANFPGIQLMTKDDIHRYGYGPVDKTVHNALFSDITLGFIVDGKGLLQDFFYKWQKAIVNFDSSDSMSDKEDGSYPYEVAYKDDYTTTLDITQFDEKNKKVVRCTAQKAFPVVVGDLQFAWAASDQIQILPVTFSYRDHKLINY